MQPSSQSPLPLEQIHRSKRSKVSDKWQSYFGFYERIFAEFRNSPIALLEIGIQNGGSLEVWAQYFPNATQFVGCDIEPKCAMLRYDDARISVIVGDANQNATAVQISNTCPAFDIVVDDGSHVSDDIINSFLRYFPVVKPGGVYIVEDTHTMYRESHNGGILKRTTAHEFFKLMVDLINYEHWEKELSLKTLFSTFVPHGPLLPILQDGWVDAIEFKNSLICIRKAQSPSHKKLGVRVVSGTEALVQQSILRFQSVPASIPAQSAVIEAVPVTLKVFADASTERSGTTLPSGPGIRLNLGCGDRILEGYVNVDAVGSRSGKAPDVICDLHQLTPFAANHADEIMAIHVIEHFWRWETEAVLREWIRVLKPGGRLVLECPNLQSACEAFVANPEARARHDKAGQTTMWVFYGDPSRRDPSMVRHWAYTPGTLTRLLQSIGLSDVRQEPAHFNLREPSDMRIVATKPAAPSGTRDAAGKGEMRP